MPTPIGGRNPVFEIQRQRYVMLTQAIATVPARELKHPIALLAAEHDTVTRALDALRLGF